MNTALLIVDVQQFYLPDLPADFAQSIANHQLALNYDVVAFAVFKNEPDSNLVKSLKWTKCDTDQDIALPSAFNDLVADDNVFQRSTYSAFVGTELHEFLQARNVERLVICGVDTHACVLATAMSAFDLGYHVKVAADLCSSGSNLHDAAIEIIRESIESRD